MLGLRASRHWTKERLVAKLLSEPGLGAKEPPSGTPDQAGLRIKSFIGIKVLSEPGFGPKEPPPGNFVRTRFWCKGAAAQYPRSSFCRKM